MKLLTLFITIQLFSLSLFAQVGNEAEIKSNFNKTQNNKIFIENKGQWDDEVLYLSKVNGANVWITKSGVTYDYYIREKIETKEDVVRCCKWSD